MENSELDRVEELAKVATKHAPAPWIHDIDEEDDCFLHDAKGNSIAEFQWVLSDGTQPVAAYLTALSPDRILAFITEIRRLQAENTRLQALPTPVEGEIKKAEQEKASAAFVSVANGLAEALDNSDWDLVYGVWRNIADVLIGVKPEIAAQIKPISLYGASDLTGSPSLLVESKQQEWAPVAELPRHLQEETLYVLVEGQVGRGLYTTDLEDEQGNIICAWAHWDGEWYEKMPVQPTHFHYPPTAPTVKGGKDNE